MPRLVRDRITWVIYLQLALWCYFLYGFGPVAPLLRDELHISSTLAGLHGTGFAVGGIVGGAVIPALTRRLGRHRLVWTGLGLVSAAAVGMFTAHHLALTLTFATLGSFGGSLAVNGINSALTEHHGPSAPAAISEANAAAAGVGLIAPLIVGLTFGAGLGWRTGLVLMVGPVVLLAFLARIRIPEPIAAQANAHGPDRPLPRTYWLAFASLFATGSIEVCLTLWGSDVLRDHANVSPGVATAAVSTLIAGMVAGRLIGGRLLLVFRPTRMLLVALGVSLAGFAIFWSATVPWLAMGGLFACGLGVGLHYPLGIGLALAHSDGQPDLAAARASFAVGISFAVAPFALGALADAVGPHSAFLLVPVFVAVAAAAIARLDYVTRPPSGGGRSSDRRRSAAAPTPPARRPALGG
ncbi:sugar MFS transporter [Dactylosporangium sucinum]|uniref:MFS transporter n=1 Tax=Dactylosporangium sucinum TaxID=1424081 RepID=A0A917TQF7_9ACTN|nr:MFS transporter [Dactylosporangium sucinum]GGM32298.1 MFS transporter [Dactylosporangium sucinum]